MTYLSVHLIPFVQQCTAVLRLLTMNSVPWCCTSFSSQSLPGCQLNRRVFNAPLFSIVATKGHWDTSRVTQFNTAIWSCGFSHYSWLFQLAHLDLQETPQTCMSLLHEQMSRNTQEPTRCTYEKWTGPLLVRRALRRSLKCSTSSTSSTPDISWYSLKSLASPGFKKVKSLGKSRQRVQRSRRTL